MLEASLSVQQRRREALGERPTDAARLPLLKYRHVGIWPTGNPAQRQRFEEVLGERPALAEPAAAAQPGGSCCIAMFDPLPSVPALIKLSPPWAPRVRVSSNAARAPWYTQSGCIFCTSRCSITAACNHCT